MCELSISECVDHVWFSQAFYVVGNILRLWHKWYDILRACFGSLVAPLNLSESGKVFLAISSCGRPGRNLNMGQCVGLVCCGLGRHSRPWVRLDSHQALRTLC